jgi:ABC-type transport system involved in multi-copper enzyme maturation permease subunit
MGAAAREIFHPREHLISYGHILVVGALQWLKFGVLAAITLLIASFSNTNLFTVVMSFFVLIICHLQSLAHSFYAKAGALTPPVRVLLETLTRIFPNFQLFNLADHGWDGPLALRVAAYALVYIAAFGALAVYSFRRREI